VSHTIPTGLVQPLHVTAASAITASDGIDDVHTSNLRSRRPIILPNAHGTLLTLRQCDDGLAERARGDIERFATAIRSFDLKDFFFWQAGFGEAEAGEVAWLADDTGMGRHPHHAAFRADHGGLGAVVSGVRGCVVMSVSLDG
jgi:hypothetical protein